VFRVLIIAFKLLLSLLLYIYAHKNNLSWHHPQITWWFA